MFFGVANQYYKKNKELQAIININTECFRNSNEGTKSNKLLVKRILKYNYIFTNLNAKFNIMSNTIKCLSLFQARIAMLLGERKCLESLKSDLTRRIKMLEYALRQERAKFYRLKYGTDPPQLNELKPSADDSSLGGEVAPDSEVPYSSVSNTTWRQGREMLNQYLAEIGYTDKIIDVRSNRVRSILGLNNNAEQEENVSPNVNGNENNKRASESEGRFQQLLQNDYKLILFIYF